MRKQKGKIMEEQIKKLGEILTTLQDVYIDTDQHIVGKLRDAITILDNISIPVEAEVKPVACGNWVGVEDGLPTDKQKVIVIQNPETTATREPLFAIYNADDKRFLDPAGSIDGIHLSTCKWIDIIYWMPLPSKPSA